MDDLNADELFQMIAELPPEAIKAAEMVLMLITATKDADFTNSRMREAFSQAIAEAARESPQIDRAKIAELISFLGNLAKN